MQTEDDMTMLRALFATVIMCLKNIKSKDIDSTIMQLPHCWKCLYLLSNTNYLYHNKQHMMIAVKCIVTINANQATK